MARPSDYTDEIADTICDRLASGESLRKMCAEDGMPDEATVYRWLRKNEAFCEQYTRARMFQAEPHLEDILAIADDDDIKPDDKRVRIDARKWAMSKLASKKYGDKITNEHSGPDGEPITIVERRIVRPGN